MKPFRLSIFLLAAAVYTLTKVVMLFFFCAIFLYLLPSIIAIRRDHPHAQSIFWLNVLLGWTVIFWAALFPFAQAFHYFGRRSVQVNQESESDHAMSNNLEEISELDSN
jgi:hypothetical protein